MQAAVRTEHLAIPDCEGKILSILIDRPEKANAFGPDVISEMTSALEWLTSHAVEFRCAVISGSGKHFSAGADLEWMRSAKDLTEDQNKADALKLRRMFAAADDCPVPIIACTQGAVFGGAVGLTACADIVLAATSTKFCLSEVRLGILPAVILPFLRRRIAPGPLRELSLTGRVFRANEAKALGLVSTVCEPDELSGLTLETINSLLQGGPEAQRSIKHLLKNLDTPQPEEANLTANAIAAARTGREGQEGLASFFAKTSPSWQATIKQWNVSHAQHT